MAFNWQTFRTRSLTAIIFVMVMLAGLFLNQWSFLLLFSIIHFGCWWEYLRLVEKIHQTTFHSYVKLGLMLIGYGLMLWFCGPAFQLSGYGLKQNFSLPFSIAGFILLITGIFQKNKVDLRSFGAAALGLLYLSVSWGLMLNFYGMETKEPLLFKTSPAYLIYFPLIMIGCMWINDTMAYIVGSLIGKTPLSKISPKKTWEGTVGGILLSAIIMGYLGYSLDSDAAFGGGLIFWMGFALVAVIAGTFGDLFESWLKRMAGVKDSGHIMPGHGGFLDRFDSLVFSIPFLWLYVKLLLR